MSGRFGPSLSFSPLLFFSPVHFGLLIIVRSLSVIPSNHHPHPVPLATFIDAPKTHFGPNGALFYDLFVLAK